MEAVATVVWMDCRSVLALWVRGMMVVDAVETVVQAVGYRLVLVATVIVEAMAAVVAVEGRVGRMVGGGSGGSAGGGSGTWW